jgi:hypothetical protein
MSSIPTPVGTKPVSRLPVVASGSQPPSLLRQPTATPFGKPSNLAAMKRSRGSDESEDLNSGAAKKPKVALQRSKFLLLFHLLLRIFFRRYVILG